MGPCASLKASAPGSGNRVRVPNHCRHDSFENSGCGTRFGLPSRGCVFAYSRRAERSVPRCPSGATPTFVISGRGWGHRVGMAQWGAYGSLSRGCDLRQFLAHYYTGTTLGPAAVARVRVYAGRRDAAS